MADGGAIHPEQLRAARAMLRWGIVEASRRAGVSVATMTSVECESREIPAETLRRLVSAYEDVGVRFQSDEDGGCGVYHAAATRPGAVGSQ